MTATTIEEPSGALRTRYADRTHVDTRQISRMLGLSVDRVRELARLRERAELLAGDEQATTAERVEARAYLRHKAIPACVLPRRWIAGQVWRWAYRTERVDDDARPRRPPTQGRSPGGPPAMPLNRRTLPEQLAALDHVDVPDAVQEHLRPLLAAGYETARLAGMTAGQARQEAVRDAARLAAVDRDVAAKVMLRLAVANARATVRMSDVADVKVTDLDRAVLLPALVDAFAQARRRGDTAVQARAWAVEEIARARRRSRPVVWRVLLEARNALT